MKVFYRPPGPQNEPGRERIVLRFSGRQAITLIGHGALPAVRLQFYPH